MTSRRDRCGAPVWAWLGLGDFVCARKAGHAGDHEIMLAQAAGADLIDARRDCPHGERSTPDRCSQCLPGIIPQRITLDGARILVDGADSGRLIDHEKAITARRRAKR